MSAVRTMQSLSLLSSLRAIICALVKLGLGGWEDLRTWLISALSSSASCWLNLGHADSMAVMYSKLGGCLGETAKLSPLAMCLSQRFAGQVNEPLRVRFFHGRTLGVVCPTVVGGSVTSLRVSSTCLGSSAVLLGSLECPSWAPVAPAWTATCLHVIVISRGVAPASWEPA